jgi:hypothetical protein
MKGVDCKQREYTSQAPIRKGTKVVLKSLWFLTTRKISLSYPDKFNISKDF